MSHVVDVPYIAGSIVRPADAGVEILGWVEGLPVMGVAQTERAKIFFLGHTNGLESVPQPLVDNLIAWGF